MAGKNSLYAGNEEMAKLLLSKGADVNAKDKDGKTPLRYALDYKHPNVASVLRQHGAKE